MSKWNVVVSLFCAFMISAVISGCGSSGSSSPSSNTPAAPAEFSQSLLDSDTVWAINNGTMQIYNDNLAGHPVGTQNLTANCPLGGTVQITGTTQFSNNTGITTVNLTHAMTNCRVTKTSASGTTVTLTLTGSVEQTGGFNASTGFQSVNYQSQTLAMTGTAHRNGYTDAAVNNPDCAYSGSNTSSDGSTSSTSGSVCGRAVVSWTN